MAKMNSAAKRLPILLLACILCSLAFTACANQSAGQASGSAQSQSSGATQSQSSADKAAQADIEKMIVGKWILADRDGEPQPTNKKYVVNFTPDAKAYVSCSLNWNPEVNAFWEPIVEADVSINGSTVTLTANYDGNMASVDEYAITAIDDDAFTANRKGSLTKDGTEVFTGESMITFAKVNEDYSEDIIGTWEGRCTSEGSAFDDGQEHRWEYRADGTYVYYKKDGDSWVPDDDAVGEYFVAGNLLCTRWAEGGEESREWWETSIDGDAMAWTATREDEKGGTFTATFEMKKVEG